MRITRDKDNPLPADKLQLDENEKERDNGNKLRGPEESEGARWRRWEKEARDKSPLLSQQSPV